MSKINQKTGPELSVQVRAKSIRRNGYSGDPSSVKRWGGGGVWWGGVWGGGGGVVVGGRVGGLGGGGCWLVWWGLLGGFGLWVFGWGLGGGGFFGWVFGVCWVLWWGGGVGLLLCVQRGLFLGVVGGCVGFSKGYSKSSFSYELVL